MAIQTFTKIIILYKTDTFSCSKGTQYTLHAVSVELLIWKDNQKFNNKI